MVEDEQSHATDDPPFCYLKWGTQLKFNNGTNTGPCTSSDICLCKRKGFCSPKNPCVEGQGDCDNDSECEGSLVCGQLNCANSSITNCCTKTCDIDSDCTSGECHAEQGQCRQNSEVINWSKCTPDNPCVEGEGDCDHYTDCEGRLICGKDNCASGPKGMDCCTDDGK